MLQKIGTKLRIDRGNSGKVKFTFLKDDGTAYDLSIFTVKFVVKETLTATETLISKTYTGLTGNELLVELTAEDTENLAAGNFYYGIQFEQSETSSVDTIIQDRFEILATVFNGLSQITPASVTITLQPFSYAASETVAGVAKIATTAEVTAGTDDAKIVTPKKLEEKIDSLNLNATNEILADIDDIKTKLNTKIALVKVDEVTAYADISAYIPSAPEVVYNTADNKLYTYTLTDGVGAWSAGVEASELTLYLDKSKNLLGYFSGSAFSYLSADYTKMSNLPTINGVTLTGNKTTDELGISGGASIGAGFGVDVYAPGTEFINFKNHGCTLTDKILTGSASSTAWVLCDFYPHFENYNTWEIQFEYTHAAQDTGFTCLVGWGFYNAGYKSLIGMNGGNEFFVRLNNLYNAYVEYFFDEGTKYYITVGFDGTNYYAAINTTGFGDNNRINFLSSSAKIENTDNWYWDGNGYWVGGRMGLLGMALGYNNNGSINLATFKFIADGKIIYTPYQTEETDTIIKRNDD